MKKPPQYHWSEWSKFPDSTRGEYLTAPFGMGVYQLINSKTGQLILFGKGKNLAYRMTSLLPPPYGQGNRNNENKRLYVLKNLHEIQYRTISVTSAKEMKYIEDDLKSENNHLFNT